MVKTPKAVVFDLGKVLVDFDYGLAARKIAARSALGETGVRNLLDHTPLLFRYETGLLTREQFYEEVRLGTGYRGGFEEFCAHFADIFWEIEPMIAWQAALRAQGMPTFIFSNTNDLAVGHIRNKFPFFSCFDGYILSYEHGAMKPDARLYEVVERQTGQTGDAIVYLDDRAENIATAVGRGWRGLLHETPAKSFAALQTMGLLVPALK
jgi:FMN phosphatase YigB (HAD superfamily)